LVGVLNSDLGIAWGLLCLHPNTIKPGYYYYSSQFDDFVVSHFGNGGIVKMTLNAIFIITNQFLTSK
jgi:hypothetical protein